jgi:polyferredoxin
MKLLKFKKTFSYNFIIRIFFLLITPLFFQYFALGFIWHSIYWGVITFVMILWGILIVSTPLIGRIGCGWFCFFGTASDLSSQHSFYKIKWKKPKLWLRIFILFLFFSSSFSFYFLNANKGLTHDFALIPNFLELNFDKHYQLVWVIDISIALLFGLIAERRWMCRNVCPIGSLCSVGAKYSRLLPVVDTSACTLCSQCEKDCLVRIPMVDYIKNNKGLITNSECILCGKCVEVCHVDAIKLKFIWDRNKHKEKSLDVLQSIRKRNKVKSQNKKRINKTK